MEPSKLVLVSAEANQVLVAESNSKCSCWSQPHFHLDYYSSQLQNIDSYDDDSNWSSDHTFPAEMSQIIGSDSHHEFKPNLFEFDVGLIHSTSSSILHDVMCKGVVLYVFPVLHVLLRRITG